MILYFSGTGNSEYAAKRIGKEIHDEAVSLFEKIRSHDFSEMSSDNPWVVVVPNYARRIPRIVQEWLMNTRLIGNKKIYFVITCGGSAGNPGKYLKKLCTAKSLSYMGYTAITMPKNYSDADHTDQGGGVGNYPAVRACDRQGGSGNQERRTITGANRDIYG